MKRVKELLMTILKNIVMGVFRPLFELAELNRMTEKEIEETTRGILRNRRF